MDTPLVFISHSSHNAQRAMEICTFLESHGVKCWIAPRDIRPGTAYPSEITRGIKACPVFLVILTKESVGSPHVNTETDIAFNNNKRIIPFFIDKVTLGDSMSYYLARKQWILGYDNYAQASDTLLSSIAEAVERLDIKGDGPAADDSHPSDIGEPNRPGSPQNTNAQTFQGIFQKYKAVAVAAILVVGLMLIGRACLWDGGDNRTKAHGQQNTVPESAATARAAGDTDAAVNRYRRPTTQTLKLNTETTVNGKDCVASWEIIDNNYSMDLMLRGRIESRIGAHEGMNCNLWLHKKSLEGAIEDMDGADIGYFEGKISSFGSGYKITGKIIVRGEDYSYTEHPCTIEIASDKEVRRLIDRE